MGACPFWSAVAAATAFRRHTAGIGRRKKAVAAATAASKMQVQNVIFMKFRGPKAHADTPKGGAARRHEAPYFNANAGGEAGAVLR